MPGEETLPEAAQVAPGAPTSDDVPAFGGIQSTPKEAPPEPTQEPGNQEPAQTPEATKEEPKETPEATEPKVDEAERTAFLEQAKKLGYAVDRMGRVAHVERKKFRDEKAQAKEELNREAARAKQDLEAWFAERAPKVQRAEAIEAAIEAGDFDGIARALGKKEWNELTTEVLNRLQDPQYQTIRKLEAKMAEQEERERNWAEQQRQKEEQAKRTQALQEVRTKVSGYMAKSTNPLIQAMHDDPLFLNTVLNAQQEAWTQAGEELTPEEVLETPRGQAARKHLEGLYQKLHKVFGGEAKPEPKETDPKPNGKAKKPPIQVPQRAASNASGKAKYKDDDDFLAQWHQRILRGDY